MSALNSFFENNIGVMFVGCFVCFIVLLVWACVCSGKLKKMRVQYGEFMGGKAGASLEDVVLDALTLSRQAVADASINQKQLADHEGRIQGCTQGIGVVRYNAFEDMGGDLSFSMALLDQKCSGIVVTCMTGRQDNRFYCKPITAGKSIYPLSPEEENAIKDASGR